MTINAIAWIVMTSVILMPTFGQAFASNVQTWAWSDASQEFLCTSSLVDITKTSNIDPCGDLTTSSNVWEGISGSTWSLTETSSGHPVYAWTTLSDGVLGETHVFLVDGEPDSAYIVMNKNESWEDSAQDTSSDGYDWRSLTGHEFGHLAGMKHCSGSCIISVMQTSWSENEVQRSPDTHDDSEMANKY